MDIDLLSKMVKELILVNDRVTLPGVGAFVAEMVPASFTDRGYTINPPYRRLVFRQGVSQEKGDWENGLFFTGSNAYRIKEKVSVKELISEILGEYKEAMA